MSASVFIDTDILVYLFDDRTPAKQRRAAQLLQELAETDDALIISTQVIQEAFVALTRKLSIEPKQALALLQPLEPAILAIQPVEASLVWRAASRSINDKLSFWDALIVEAALAADCTTLYSEDLQHGRSFGAMRVENPFQ
jgi:predicted nucleic acid-binding protein